MTEVNYRYLKGSGWIPFVGPSEIDFSGPWVQIQIDTYGTMYWYPRALAHAKFLSVERVMDLQVGDFIPFIGYGYLITSLGETPKVKVIYEDGTVIEEENKYLDCYWEGVARL